MSNTDRRQQLHARQLAHARAEQRRGRLRRLFGWGAFAVVIAVVAGMLVTSQSTSATTSNTAPDFTLRTTADADITLSTLRGRPVVLYFNEGAGCAACILQMGEVEQNQAEFDALGVTMLPIVMNSKAEIAADLARYGVTTPFLLDDGTVSQAYGTLGKGMHADLPGHSFVLIDEAGIQRWYGEYPSMWLGATDLLNEIRGRLQG